MSGPTTMLDLSETLCHLLAESEFSRETMRLVTLLRRVRNRLAAFAELDPTLEMIAGLEARGVGPATAAERVSQYLGGYADPEAAREAAQSLVWNLGAVADVLESVAL